MAIRNSAKPQQLAMLTRILDEYCQHAGVARTHPAREHLARRLIALFKTGIDSPAAIRMALDSVERDFKPTAEGSAPQKVRFAAGRI